MLPVSSAVWRRWLREVEYSVIRVSLGWEKRRGTASGSRVLRAAM